MKYEVGLGMLIEMLQLSCGVNFYQLTQPQS